MRIIVTGAAGFIGAHLLKRLLDAGHDAIGIDNFCEHPYPSKMKHRRVKAFSLIDHIRLLDINMISIDDLAHIFHEQRTQCVVHLAALANGSLTTGRIEDYYQTNVLGSVKVFEAANIAMVDHVLYASSASACRPIANHYARTKQIVESLVENFRIGFTRFCGFRFHSVYGPWGRPDQCFFQFASLMDQGKPIPLNTDGESDVFRSWTYIDDVVDWLESWSLDRRFDFPEIIDVRGPEFLSLKTAVKELATHFDLSMPLKFKYNGFKSWDIISQDNCNIGPTAKTPLHEGLKKFVDWYFDFSTFCD